MRSVLILGLFLTLNFCGFSQEEKLPTPEELTAKVLKVYASCESYRDRCVIRIVEPDFKKGEEAKAFAKTAYQKDGVFRFQFADPRGQRGEKTESFPPQEIIWLRGGEIQLKSDATVPMVKGNRTAEEARTHARSLLFGMSLMTCESSSEIPLLVLPAGKSKIGSYFEANRCAIEQSEIVDHHPCYKMVQSSSGINGRTGQPMQVFQRYWIDKKSDLIRRYQSERDFGTGEKRVFTLDYQPEINVKLSPEELELDAPKK